MATIKNIKLPYVKNIERNNIESVKKRLAIGRGFKEIESPITIGVRI